MTRPLHRWTDEELIFLKNEYPSKGLVFCAYHLNMKHSQIRTKASYIGIKQDKSSDFFKDWQSRAAKSKIGKKRPGHAIIISSLHKEGRLYKFVSTSEEISVFMKNWHKNNEHPKGFSGHKHSDSTKEIMSDKSKQTWENMSEENRDKMSLRASINGQKMTMNRANASWKCGWREIGGKRNYYRSRWEANYGMYLQWLKENKQIIEWEHEPETFWFEGIKRGCMSYLPDFRVIESNGSIAYHEVKGWMDDRSKTKIKRMAKYHPNIKLIVIDSKCYKSLAKTMKPIITEWEK